MVEDGGGWNTAASVRRRWVGGFGSIVIIPLRVLSSCLTLTLGALLVIWFCPISALKETVRKVTEKCREEVDALQQAHQEAMQENDDEVFRLKTTLTLSSLSLSFSLSHSSHSRSFSLLLSLLRKSLLILKRVSYITTYV
jgi:hypothetical protein